MTAMRRDSIQTFFTLLFVGGLIGASLWILRPFLGAAIWAVTIVVTTWPLMMTIQGRLWNSRFLAVFVMTMILLCVLVVPLWLAIGTIVSNADRIAGWARALPTLEVPPPPAWIEGVPLFGGYLTATWKTIAVDGLQDIVRRLAPYGTGLIRWFAAEAGGIGVLILQFLLTVVFTAILYARGELAASWTIRFAQRLAGPQGEHSVRLAGQAIRGVALGVVVTALAQSVLGGIGLAIAGVPFAPILTALMFMTAIAQIGVVPVLVPSVIWVYWSEGTGWGTFLLAWTVVVGTMDNFLRPFLIKKGADLPLLLIFTGVIGGLVAFGIIGLFVGPVVLAVAQKLLAAWVDEGTPAEEIPAHDERKEKFRGARRRGRAKRSDAR